MTHLQLYPLSFEPIFQYRLWGGRRLGGWMNKPLPDGPIGEAWILSDRDDHASEVAEGPLRGKTITELMAQAKAAILGDHAGRFERFPLLLKFLDVREMLSVQVHPRDDQTELLPVGESGKTEAWVVLDADPCCRIYAGLKSGATAKDLGALTTTTANDYLASFKPKVGQGVLIKAGTVHALGYSRTRGDRDLAVPIPSLIKKVVFLHKLILVSMGSFRPCHSSAFVSVMRVKPRDLHSIGNTKRLSSFATDKHFLEKTLSVCQDTRA